MIGLLRADLIRLRARLDLWVVGLAVPVLAGVGFVRGYFDVPNHFGFPEGDDIPAEVIAQINAQIALEQSHFAFPYSVLTMLDSVPWVLLAAFFITAMTIGGEYGWGTIRTALLASTDRHRFLASRCIWIATVATAMVGLLLALALVLPGILGLAGNALPTPVTISAADLGLAIAARLLVVGFVVALSALLAIVTRNPALPLLLAIIYFIVEGIVTTLPFFRGPSGAGTWPTHLFPFASVLALMTDSARAVLPIDQQVVAQDQVVWPLWLSLAVVAGWFTVFYVVADRIFGRSDIRE